MANYTKTQMLSIVIKPGELVTVNFPHWEQLEVGQLAIVRAKWGDRTDQTFLLGRSRMAAEFPAWEIERVSNVRYFANVSRDPTNFVFCLSTSASRGGAVSEINGKTDGTTYIQVREQDLVEYNSHRLHMADLFNQYIAAKGESEWTPRGGNHYVRVVDGPSEIWAYLVMSTDENNQPTWKMG